MKQGRAWGEEKEDFFWAVCNEIIITMIQCELFAFCPSDILNEVSVTHKLFLEWIL